jgi:site-specific DNA-cytosine methylase
VAVAFQPGNLVRRAGAEPNTETFPTLGATTVGDQFPHVATVAATLTHTPYADNHGHESKLIVTGNPSVEMKVASCITSSYSRGVDQGCQDEVNVPYVETPQGTLDSVSTNANTYNIFGGNKREDRPEGGFYVRENERISKTLDSATGLNPTCAQGGTAVLNRTSGVRRLTPRETERLQGWPDDHTLFRRPAVLEGNRWVPKGESREQADGSRYKQVGNGIAAPCAAWVARRIAKKMMEE